MVNDRNLARIMRNSQRRDANANVLAAAIATYAEATRTSGDPTTAEIRSLVDVLDVPTRSGGGQLTEEQRKQSGTAENVACRSAGRRNEAGTDQGEGARQAAGAAEEEPAEGRGRCFEIAAAGGERRDPGLRHQNKCTDIVRHLKPHQMDGVKFILYDSCYGSVDDKTSGSGCILAHCMGLGKASAADCAAANDDLGSVIFWMEFKIQKPDLMYV